jgi:hypothetical protein
MGKLKKRIIVRVWICQLRNKNIFLQPKSPDFLNMLMRNCIGIINIKTCFPDNLVQWKKPSRFEVVLCTTTTTDDQRSETGSQDQNLNDRLSGLTTLGSSVDEPKVPHFSLCCNEGISTLPMMPKKMPLLHPDRSVS